jgi:predicted AlkP superfamily phosphohydrolase/phosphomutase
MKSPIIWTTIATGKGPQKHGISDFLQGADAQPLFNSDGWRARPIWDILSEKGLTVGVINWMVTWPAQPVNGYIVTERILYRPEDGFEPTERVTYPGELDQELAPYARPISDVADDELAPLLNGDAWKDGSNTAVASAVSTLKDVYGNDETVRGVTKYLLDSRKQPDFFAVYFGGVDMSSHFFWGPMDPTTVDIQMDPEMVKTCSDIIPRYYQRMDGIIGEILERLDEDSTIILCSDHGFRGPYRTPKAGAKITDASVFDVTPTILALLGEPVGRDMDGFVLESAISPARLREVPVTYIDTYETTSYAPRAAEQTTEPVQSSVDDEIKERLKSLGYIE